MPMPCSSAAAMCAGTSRRASRPPWTRGCSVLTRPSIISGKPVRSSMGRTGTPASASALAVPPVETISTPNSLTSARQNSTTPVLSVTETSARLMETFDIVAGSPSVASNGDGPRIARPSNSRGDCSVSRRGRGIVRGRISYSRGPRRTRRPSESLRATSTRTMRADHVGRRPVPVGDPRRRYTGPPRDCAKELRSSAPSPRAVPPLGPVDGAVHGRPLCRKRALQGIGDILLGSSALQVLRVESPRRQRAAERPSRTIRRGSSACTRRGGRRPSPRCR